MPIHEWEPVPILTPMFDFLAPRPPQQLEYGPGCSQCAYELLRAFARYAKKRRTRFALAAGTLLGAMRNDPPGLLQWEHDVDVYMPAQDASTLLHHLRRDCRQGRWYQHRSCATLHFRGLVDRSGRPCCGFGFKIFHRKSDACELDVLVLSTAPSPMLHGETLLWPPWSAILAAPYSWLATLWVHVTSASGTHYVLAHDVRHQSLMADDTRWCKPAAASSASSAGEWAWCGGPALSFFHAEYFAPGDLFPLGLRPFHDLKLPVPHRPWALLNRTYGPDCAFMARLNEHHDATADVRKPEYAHLIKPARVRSWLPWWRS